MHRWMIIIMLAPSETSGRTWRRLAWTKHANSLCLSSIPAKSNGCWTLVRNQWISGFLCETITKRVHNKCFTISCSIMQCNQMNYIRNSFVPHSEWLVWLSDSSWFKRSSDAFQQKTSYRESACSRRRLCVPCGRHYSTRSRHTNILRHIHRDNLFNPTPSSHDTPACRLSAPFAQVVRRAHIDTLNSTHTLHRICCTRNTSAEGIHRRCCGACLAILSSSYPTNVTLNVPGDEPQGHSQSAHGWIPNDPVCRYSAEYGRAIISSTNGNDLQTNIIIWFQKCVLETYYNLYK